MNGLPLIDALWRDVRYAVRILRRTPGFTLTAVATLAVVIGANTAVFSLANELLLRPLPYPDADRLALLHLDLRSPRGSDSGVSVDGATWFAAKAVLPGERAAPFSNWITSVNLAVDGRATLANQQRVGAGFFRVLGVSPVIGREFEPAEDVPNGPAVAILSQALWTGAFNRDPDIFGRTILLRGESWQVVGVMPAGFRSTADADVWTPLRPSTTGEGAGTNYGVLVRVDKGVPWRQAEQELHAALGRPLRAKLDADVTVTVGLKPLGDELVAETRAPIVMLGAAAITVLIIACVNLAALMLARGGRRSKEIATRMALGSGRWAVVRQLMAESLVIALAGGVLGLVIGWFGLRGLQALGGDLFSDWNRVTIDAPVLLWTGGLAMFTSLLFGLIPAWSASRLDVQQALTESGSRGIAGGSRHWLRRGLIVVEVALGVVLLVSAGLLLRTFVNLRSVDPGFNPRNLSTAAISLLDARYPSPADVNRLFDRVLERLQATPGVESAAVSLGLPYQRVLNMGFAWPGDASRIASVMYTSPAFFHTLEIPLRRGRTLAATDAPDRQPVVVVNEAFARTYSRDRDVVGRRLRMSGAEREVVGVVADVQMRPAFTFEGMVPGPIVASPAIYVPAAQISQGLVGTHIWFQPVITVRAASHVTAQRAIENAVASADPLLPLGQVWRMSDVRAAATAEQNLLMTLVGALALAALLLAAIGLHGLISCTVIERTREFGIRLALGAAPGGVVRTVAAGGVALAVVGGFAGAALALPATSLVRAVLYRVAERDLWTYVGAIAFLVIVAAIASLIPALRILRLDPAETLRQ